MLKCFLRHICKIYHQTRCCIFSLNSLKGEIIVICIVLARKSTDFFWQGIAISGNQDTGLGFATNHGNSMRIFLRLFVAIWCPSIGVSIIWTQVVYIYMSNLTLVENKIAETKFVFKMRIVSKLVICCYMVSIHWRLYNTQVVYIYMSNLTLVEIKIVETL